MPGEADGRGGQRLGGGLQRSHNKVASPLPGLGSSLFSQYVTSSLTNLPSLSDFNKNLFYQTGKYNNDKEIIF